MIDSPRNPDSHAMRPPAPGMMPLPTGDKAPFTRPLPLAVTQRPNHQGEMVRVTEPRRVIHENPAPEGRAVASGSESEDVKVPRADLPRPDPETRTGEDSGGAEKQTPDPALREPGLGVKVPDTLDRRQPSEEPGREDKAESAVARYHNPRFDPVRDEAHTFVSRDLGLRIAPKANIALITPAQAIALQAHYGDSWGGGYNPDDNTCVVIQRENFVGPITTEVYNRGATVHEITHTGTAKPDEHMFYNEALPGIAEYRYIQRSTEHGLYQPASSFVLARAGVELWVPNNMRYLDAREAVGTPTQGATGANTTQAMIAALGVGLTFPRSGLTSADLLGKSGLNEAAPYDLMRYSLNALKPGLAREVESMPETTDGIIQATSIIQDEARRQHLL